MRFDLFVCFILVLFIYLFSSIPVNRIKEGCISKTRAYSNSNERNAQINTNNNNNKKNKNSY